MPDSFFFPDDLRPVQEQRLNQRGRVIWLTGLSGAGKTTLARGLQETLLAEGYFVVTLDGDDLRAGLNRDLGFSLADRDENVRRVAEVARLFARNGAIVITSLISPLQVMRDAARAIVGEEQFAEVYVNAPLAVCEQRDVKGLYARARAGLLSGFTGIDSPYEPPRRPLVTIATDQLTLPAAVAQLRSALLPLVQYAAHEDAAPITDYHGTH